MHLVKSSWVKDLPTGTWNRSHIRGRLCGSTLLNWIWDRVPNGQLLHFSQICMQVAYFQNHVEKRKQWTNKKHHPELTTNSSLSVSRLHIMYPLKLMISLRYWYHLADQTEVKDWIRGVYPKLLNEWFSLKSSRTIWKVYVLLGSGNWSLGFYALRVELDIVDVQYTLWSQISASLQSHAYSALRGCFENRV